MYLSSYQRALLQGSPDSLIYSRNFGQWTETSLRSSWLSPMMTQVKSCFAKLSAFWLYISSVNLVDCPKISPPKISVVQNMLITTQPPSSLQPVTAMGPALLSVMCVTVWFQLPRSSSFLLQSGAHFKDSNSHLHLWPMEGRHYSFLWRYWCYSEQYSPPCIKVSNLQSIVKQTNLFPVHVVAH